ncbi:MAG: ThiF family adenylyltransferase [Polyangiales bacterium]
MIDLVFPGDSLTTLTNGLRGPDEGAAVALARPAYAGPRTRLLVQRAALAPDDAYAERTRTAVRLHDDYTLRLENEARRHGWSVVYCHTHPGSSGIPRFSGRDDASEKALADYLHHRNPGKPHVSLLIGDAGLSARVLGTSDTPVRVVEVGRSVRFHGGVVPALELAPEHDRQILAFGEEGQRLLHSLRVGVVGLGGTGSVVAQQLAHLGVDDYVLIDHDHLDRTNLNRVAGARPRDVGAAKIAVAERMIRELRPSPRIESHRKDVALDGTARALLATDFVFCCTDSHAGRDLLNHLAAATSSRSSTWASRSTPSRRAASACWARSSSSPRDSHA